MILDDLDRHARERPGERAVVEISAHGTVRELNWDALKKDADGVAAALGLLGVVVGEPVAFQLPNRLEFVAIALGVLRAGGVCEPLMPIFRERELEFMLAESRARVLFVPDRFRGRDYAAMANGLRSVLPDLRHVVVLPGAYQRLLAEAPRVSGPAPDPHGVAQLLFTSGTSGEPKGALQRHDVLDRAADHHIEHFGLGPDDVIYVPSPLAHQTGFLYGMWIALRLGVPQVLQEVWDAETGLGAMRRFGVTFVQAATPFLADLTRVAQDSGGKPERLRTFVATGAAIPRELARRSREVLGAEVGGAWGTTESCLGCAFAPGDPPERAWATDGRALAGVEIRVVDELGEPLPAGEEGNFEVHTDCLFDGYLGRPDLTAEAITADGWYRTGDLARIEESGYVRITGRVKDVINRGGEKVPVAEIEQLLHAHPAVADVAVVAMPDERLGERACAFVVLADRYDPAPHADLAHHAGPANDAGPAHHANPAHHAESEFGFETMLEYLDSCRVAKTYWPERLELVDSLPRTPSGKIQKFVLRAQIRELVTT
ncbi:MAG: AMP-binding protein [Solirubrobacterales bacterium]|nr:AMP-binding protein [Solirubrobacterales bacterium]